MLQAASDLLYEMSGHQFPGICEVTLRPCAAPRRAAQRDRSYDPPGWIGSWGYCGCGDTCGCAPWYGIELGPYPITGVSEVKVDGVVLDPSRYRVDDWRTLRRLADADGSNPGWPSTQHLDLADTEEGTWSVTFEWGREPPASGVRASAVLACELALSCDPENADQCRLPKRATSVTREGVTVVLSPSDFLDDRGHTGLFEVDIFLRAVNPERIRRGASVWHVGMARGGVRPGT